MWSSIRSNVLLLQRNAKSSIMETIRFVEEHRGYGEVKMHMKAWTVLHKEQVDPGKNMRLIVRILDSEKQPADHTYDPRSSTGCGIANFISSGGTDDARKIARDLLFSVISSDGDPYEWSASTLPLLEVEFFHFCYQAASTMKDYIEATRYEYGEIQVFVDISRPSSLKKQQDLEISTHENNGCQLVESVGDNFELLERVDAAAAGIENTAEAERNYNSEVHIWVKAGPVKIYIRL